MDELNRDLLVAVLALLTDAIPRHALSVALSAWARDRQQTLAQILSATAPSTRNASRPSIAWPNPTSSATKTISARAWMRGTPRG